MLFFFSGCDLNDEDEGFGAIQMNFQSNFGDEPLLMYAQEYDYESGMKLKLQLFQFYNVLSYTVNWYRWSSFNYQEIIYEGVQEWHCYSFFSCFIYTLLHCMIDDLLSRHVINRYH